MASGGFSKNHVPRRIHKERPQLLSRVSKHGLLEKKRDYKLRAKNRNRKERQMTVLKEKARFRNPDEFYHSMINQRTNNGVIQRKVDSNISVPLEHRKHDERLLAETQDSAYVAYKLSVERGKVNSLKQNLHFIKNKQDKKGKHILFVDDEDKQSEVIKRKENEKVDEQQQFHSNHTLNLLEKRQQRERKLSTVYNDMSLEKHLLSKGGRELVKKGDKKNGTPPIFRWLQERKR